MIRKPGEIIVKVVKAVKFGETVQVDRFNAAESSSKVKTEKVTLHLAIWGLLVTFLKAV